MTPELKHVALEDLYLWVDAPRLPKSLRNEIKDMSAEERIIHLIPYYIMNTNCVPLAGALSVIGWSPIEYLWTANVRRNLTVIDGASRVVAAYLLLHPEYPNCPRAIKEYRTGMTHKELQSIATQVPVMLFTSEIDEIYKKRELQGHY